MTGDEDMNFYEDDEPIEKIVAAFERGEKTVTAPPSEDPVRKLVVKISGFSGQGQPPDEGSAASEDVKVSLIPG